MKHLSAILALAALIFASLACSDGGGGGETIGSENKTTVTKTEPADNTTAEKDSAGGDAVTLQWLKLYTDDGSGGEGVEVKNFKPTDNPQHFVARLSEFEGGTKVRFVITAVNADGVQNFKVVEGETETSSYTNQTVFTAKLPRPFPVGDYRADAYINGKLSKSVAYKVQ